LEQCLWNSMHNINHVQIFWRQWDLARQSLRLQHWALWMLRSWSVGERRPRWRTTSAAPRTASRRGHNGHLARKPQLAELAFSENASDALTAAVARSPPLNPVSWNYNVLRDKIPRPIVNDKNNKRRRVRFDLHKPSLTNWSTITATRSPAVANKADRTAFVYRIESCTAM